MEDSRAGAGAEVIGGMIGRAAAQGGLVDVSGMGLSVELLADPRRGVAYVNVNGVCVLRISGAAGVAAGEA